MESVLRGIGVSPGIAIGPALIFSKSRWEAPCYEITDPGAEMGRFNAALENARRELKTLHAQARENLGDSHADIFKAHLLVLDDVVLLEEVGREVAGTRKNAEHVLEKIADRYARALESVEDARFRERAADLLDVADRVLGHLLNMQRPDLKALARPCVVLAHDLSPSDTATMDLDNTLGIAVEVGSATSHSAILARALEIPAVMGVQHALARAATGAAVVVDGSEGVVVLDPSEETLARYRRAQLEYEARQAVLLGAESGPAHTRDGVRVTVEANIELPIEIPHSLKAHAEGIGLYRTEYLFLDRNEVPTEEEQHAAYLQAAEALHPLPVTLRTMDIGGDKLVEHLQIFKEENPQLGWRAVRFCLARPEIFKAQLRAMLRASVRGNIRIMFPMISGVNELRAVKAVVAEVCAELDAAGTAYDHGIKIGSMIEVPSAVMMADSIAAECDFFSIGTNDLIQYSLAVDRKNEKIAYLYEPAHPAVLRMIARVAEAARSRGIPCGICGEMAGDPLYTEILLGLGVTSLSMSPISLPVVRAEIALINLGEARVFAAEMLTKPTAGEISGQLRQRREARAPERNA